MRYVAPRFQGQIDRIVESRDFVEDRQLDIFGAGTKAMARAFADGGKEMPEEFAKGVAALNGAAERAAEPATAD